MPDIMKQGNGYNEEKPDTAEDVNEIVYDPDAVKTKDKNKIILIAVVIAVVAVVFGGLWMYNQPQTKLTGVAAEAETGSTTASDTVSNEFQAKASVYTDAQKAALRAAGYTGDDIEKAEKQNADYQNMLDTAKAAREEQLKKDYAELSDSAKDGTSAAYKTLLNETWLSGRIRTIPKGDASNFTNLVKRDNCSYIKLPPRGNQLYIRLTLPNNTYLFFDMAPDRYAAIAEKGNMIIEYTEVTYNGEPFVTDIKEVPIWSSN